MNYKPNQTSCCQYDESFYYLLCPVISGQRYNERYTKEVQNVFLCECITVRIYDAVVRLASKRDMMRKISLLFSKSEELGA